MKGIAHWHLDKSKLFDTQPIYWTKLSLSVEFENTVDLIMHIPRLASRRYRGKSYRVSVSMTIACKQSCRLNVARNKKYYYHILNDRLTVT